MDRRPEDRADRAHEGAGGEPPALPRDAGDRLSGPLFALEGVVAKRGDRVVLHGIDLAIDRGATAVVGPSGSGKSTLLRLLDRLADPAEGRILFDGRDVRDLDVLDLRRRAVLVPQVPAPLPGTVSDNVLFGPSLCDRDGDVDVARFLDLAGLDRSYAERDAGRLSVGEQQRLMLARALALDPQALLLDEPTASLDEAARSGVERTLTDLRERVGVTLVLVTHDRGQAERIASRTIELRDGRVQG